MTVETMGFLGATGAGSEIFSAWQDGLKSLFGRSACDSSIPLTDFWTAGIDGGRIRQAYERITAGIRDLTSAQIAVAAEWLQAPLWLTGAASPQRLQSSYGRLFEAYNKLFAAYLPAAMPAPEAAMNAARRASDSVLTVASTQFKAEREVGEKSVEMQREAANGAVKVAQNGSRTATRALDQAAEIAEEAVERAEREQHREEAAEARRQRAEGFATEEEAQAAGYRRAETPGAGKIKGKITREGERIYHVAGQANYDRFEADMLFETEEAAAAAGFRAAQR